MDASDEMKVDKDVVLEAVKQNLEALRWVSRGLAKYEEIRVEIVKMFENCELTDFQKRVLEEFLDTQDQQPQPEMVDQEAVIELDERTAEIQKAISGLEKLNLTEEEIDKLMEQLSQLKTKQSQNDKDTTDIDKGE